MYIDGVCALNTFTHSRKRTLPFVGLPNPANGDSEMV